MALKNTALCLTTSRFGVSKSNGFWRNGIPGPQNIKFTRSNSLILQRRKCGFLMVFLFIGTGRSMWNNSWRSHWCFWVFQAAMKTTLKCFFAFFFSKKFTRPNAKAIFSARRALWCDAWETHTSNWVRNQVLPGSHHVTLTEANLSVPILALGIFWALRKHYLQQREGGTYTCGEPSKMCSRHIPRARL